MCLYVFLFCFEKKQRSLECKEMTHSYFSVMSFILFFFCFYFIHLKIFFIHVMITASSHLFILFCFALMTLFCDSTVVSFLDFCFLLDSQFFFLCKFAYSILLFVFYWMMKCLDSLENLFELFIIHCNLSKQYREMTRKL